MIRYDIHCLRCGSYCWGDVPLLGEDRNQNMRCGQCDFIVIQFSNEVDDS